MIHQNTSSRALFLMLAALPVLVLGNARAADVRLYGRIDTGLVFHHYSGDSVKDDTFSMDSGPNTASRWGIQGSEALSPDTTVSFRLENRFMSDDGAFKQFSKGHPGRMFGGQANMTLADRRFGEVAFGRTAGIGSGSGSYDYQVYMDAFGGGSVGNGNAPVKSTRYDNMITYRTPDIAGWQATLQYSLKTDGYDEGDEASSDVDRFGAAGLRWHRGNLNVVAAYETIFRNADAVVDRDRKVATVGGGYRFEPVTVFLQAQYFTGLDTLDGFSAKSGESIKGFGLYGGTEFWFGPSSWKTMLYWRDYRLEERTLDKDGTTLGLATKYVYRPSKTVELYAGGGLSSWDRVSAADGSVLTDRETNLFAGLTKYF